MAGNSELCRLLGVDVNDVRGRGVTEFFVHDDSGSVDARHSGSFGGSVGGTGFLRCVGDTLIEVTVTTLPLPDDHEESSMLGIVSPVAGNRIDAGQLMLTCREARLLELRAFGATNVEIARRLNLTSRGLDYNLRRLARKLDCPVSSSAMIARAYHLGLLVVNTWPPEVSPRLVEPASGRPDSSSIARNSR